MRGKLLAVSAALLLAPAAVGAQTDVTGMWNITASFTPPSEQVTSPPVCEYQGSGISLTQSGSTVTGSVMLNLVSGPTDSCPGQMTGVLNATVAGSTFSGSLDGSNNPMMALGTATVSGTLVVPASASKASAALNMTGTTTVGSGPFANATGTFAGQQAPAMSTMGPPMLAVLVLVMLSGSTLLLLRRRA